MEVNSSSDIFKIIRNEVKGLSTSPDEYEKPYVPSEVIIGRHTNSLQQILDVPIQSEREGIGGGRHDVIHSI